MSKTSKKKRSDLRKKAKRQRKEANRAKYAALRDQGKNQKSKRVVLASRRARKLRVTKHRLGSCGNVGCVKCSPVAQALAAKKQAAVEARSSK